MATIRKFEEIEAWKTARELSCRVYDITRQKPFAGDYGLKNQACRAAVSVMSNIAEGFESQTAPMFIKHLAIAKGSAGELRSQLYVAMDQKYISAAEHKTLMALTKKVSGQLSCFMSYLKNQTPRHP